MEKTNPLKKLVGLTLDEFNGFRKTNQIVVQPARLIPQSSSKADEGALTSMFLSSMRLIKEYRDGLFKEFGLKKSRKTYYYTEAHFPEIDKDSRVDGLIIVVQSNKIIDAAFFEMKSKNNVLENPQIEKYIKLAQNLKMDKLITVSNEFVPDPTHSPTRYKSPKNFKLLHFSWTYLMTQGQLLLFDNDENIEDEDQIEIMREALHYLEHADSGTTGYTQMKEGWKELTKEVSMKMPINKNNPNIQEAVLSWYEEEKDMALLLSRKLGVLVKASARKTDSIKKDALLLSEKYQINSVLTIKDAVSKIKINADFERKSVIMSISITPPLDKGSKARITWLTKQLENCSRKEHSIFEVIQENLCVDMDIKNARTDIRVKLNELHELFDRSNGGEIQEFNIVLINNFKGKFESQKGFVVSIEDMLLNYYQGIVQHVSTWVKPTPKLVDEL